MFLSFTRPLVVSAALIVMASSCSAQDPEDSATSSAACVSALTPAQMAGQRIIYSYPGLTPPQALFDRIRAGEAAGVIFFGENISSPAQIQGVISQLAAAQEASPVSAPLLLMTDQEGGEVRRLPGEPTLSEKQIGEASNGADLATQAGAGAGNNLLGVGMNVNLAPVLDVFRKAGDFDDQFQRSYSMDPNVAGQLGHNFIEAQQQTGVAATAKHFPGLGIASASQNTDEEPVTINASKSTLRSIDEGPYPAAIAAGVKLVMASWAIYPSFDKNNPAGLSPAIIQGELRTRLGFKGVTITDALEAGSLSAFGDAGQRGVLAAKAGMDLLLCSARDVGQGDTTAAALASALQNGQLDAAGFNAALQRISALRNGL